MCSHDHLKVRHILFRFILHLVALYRHHWIDVFEIKNCQKSPILQVEFGNQSYSRTLRKDTEKIYAPPTFQRKSNTNFPH